jgi:CRISPR-associated endonuclease Csn1
MKRILGLDLGTNSIGWAFIEHDFENKKGEIKGLGSRIIPMSQDVLGKFDSGVSISQTAERTGFRGTRRLYQKDTLRRERLHRVLNILGFLPQHYAESIDFEKRIGQFMEGKEIKLNYQKNGVGKHEFMFKESFNEMAKEFIKNGKDAKIPYDWTLYYLRKKALTEKISKEELAWIILNFNQKRGYYQLRGEEETEDESKLKEYCVLNVAELVDSGEKVKGNSLYNVIFTNGWLYDRQIVKTQDWKAKTKEFIVTTTLEKDGALKRDKDGNIKRSFKAVDSEQDWIAIKKKTEQDIDKSKKTVGQFIYETLLDNPKQKVRGKLVRTVERKFYKDELTAILKEQQKHHSELQSKNLFVSCIEELYHRNEAHQNFLKDKDFVHLFIDDIIFYQRPLKSKKSSISNCQYEYRVYKKSVKIEENGNTIEKEIFVNEPLKAISKSNPLFQEFRLWQFLKNLKIYPKGVEDTDVTSRFFQNEDDWVECFDFLNSRKELEQKQLLDFFVKKGKLKKDEKENFRWNYVEDKKYPCNDTKTQLISRLKKVEGIEIDDFLTTEVEKNLWHIIYSVSDKNEYIKSLKTFAIKHNIDENSFIENFKKFPPFKSEYGAYSEKAIKKLLPLMRRGKHWNEDDITTEVKERGSAIIERLKSINFNFKKIDENVVDDDIPKQLLKSFSEFENNNPFRGLNTYQACYLVYNRHSETSTITQWKNPSDISKYLEEFKQHSLRNPIVEQVVTETLRVVKDIWEYYGNSTERLFDEIHVELGREMKNPANRRSEMSKRVTENENTNQRIRELLKELMNDSNVEGDIRPYSPSHQEILKIYEEGIYQNPNANYLDLSFDDIEKIRKNASPSKSDILRYKLWLEQGYISPYTGRPIPLSKLFTTNYQIEHIIPQSRYFDDSLSNKIICESEVNQLKDNQTAYEFLKNEKGRIVELAQGKTVKLLTLEDYEAHCNEYFKKNRSKLKKLLSEDIPEDFIKRQLNDSRYISKLIKGLLSNLVREENEVEATSKHIIPVTGAITSTLKNDWGLNDKWNEIVAPRFKRLNEITNTQEFGFWDKKINAFRTSVPDSISRGFNKKRIDHRHHALDALIIASTNIKHTQYLNALNAENKNYSLRDTLLVKNKNDHYTKHFLLPWSSFPINALESLEKTVISFKQNLRVINKTNNKTWQWVNNNGKLKKELVKQTKGDNWAIRKPMHKDTVSGIVNLKTKKTLSFANGIKEWENLVDKDLKKIVKRLVENGQNDKAISKYFNENPYPSKDNKTTKVEVYTFTNNATATRIALTEKFTRKQLNSVTDSGIRKIVEKHLINYIDEKGKERFDLAFSTDGLDELNKNITVLNNAKFHHPIYKVRIFEEGKKFQVGIMGSKNKKYVEAAKGTNLFFAIYWNEEKQKREFETIPLNEVIEFQKWRATLPKEEQKTTPMIPVNNEKGKFLFSLSPNDLVYVPTEDELINPELLDFSEISKEQASSIYKMVSSTGAECHFVQNHVSTLIKTYDAKTKVGEFGSLNKMETDFNGARIKECCWKIVTDRLGNITKDLK